MKSMGLSPSEGLYDFVKSQCSSALNNEQKRVIVNYIINNVYDKYDLKSSIKTFIRNNTFFSYFQD